MAVCFIVVRNVSDKGLLVEALQQYTRLEGRGIHFNLDDAFCEMPYLSLDSGCII